MSKFLKLLFLLFVLLVILYVGAPIQPYAKMSKVHNIGLFAEKDYHKGDIILHDVFPGKDDNEILFNPIKKDIFQKFISYEGTLINHCSVNFNSDMVSKNHKKYKVIATKTILKDQEIFANYDNINKKYPFIAKALEGYKVC